MSGVARSASVDAYGNLSKWGRCGVATLRSAGGGWGSIIQDYFCWGQISAIWSFLACRTECVPSIVMQFAVWVSHETDFVSVMMTLCKFSADDGLSFYGYQTNLSEPWSLYGSEIWHISKSECLMLERIHRKILRTIQGLPIRCPSKALTSLLGSRDISSLISQHQLTFINSIASMSPDDLPRQLLAARLATSPTSGVIPTWNHLLDDLHLPSLAELFDNPRPKDMWKNSIKRLLNIEHYISLTDHCDDYLIGSCSHTYGKPAKHWSITIDRKATSKCNFRIRMLVGCDGLELDASRFRTRRTSSSPSCKLCHSAPEGPTHFILRCPSLALRRSELLSDCPDNIAPHIPDPSVDPDGFTDVMTGVEWIPDKATQIFIIDFIAQLRNCRNELLLHSQHQ